MLTDENLRFIKLVEDLRANDKVADYVQLAAVLGTNKAGISDIKSGRKKISVELLRRMKTSYPHINLEWVIMGVGDMYCLDSDPNIQPIAVTGKTSIADFFKQFNPVIEQKDAKLLQQAEELGQLREQLAQAQRELDQLRFEKNESASHHVPCQTEVAL